jgi:Uma2 family endonuclease
MELVESLVSEKEVEYRVLSEYELERGKPMPNLTHGSLQANLIIQLAIYVSQFRIASEVALATEPEGSTPDIVLYSKRELNFKTEIAKQSEAPLLAIEIQSPSQSIEIMLEKVAKYFEFGVKSCWIVYPAMKAIAVYSDADNYSFYDFDDLLKDEKLNIELDLKQVFI